MSDQGSLDGETTAITDVDCTPRPRRGEPVASFEARIRGYGRAIAAQAAANNKRNRAAALQPPTVGADGIAQYFTRCSCGWCGLRVADPELAQREYDAHPCAMDAVEIGESLHRQGDGLGAAWAAGARAQIEQRELERSLTGSLGPQEYRQAPYRPLFVEVPVSDDAEQRAKLLELT